MMRPVICPAWRGAGGFLLALAALCLGFIATAPGATFTAALDRNSMIVGESVALSLTYNSAGNISTPVLPPLPNLTVVSTSQGRNIVINNGQQTVQVTFSYQLSATQPGDVIIPSIQGNADGVALATQPLPLRIAPPDANAAAAAQSAISNLAFVRIVVPKTEVYLGEPVPIEMHLYWQDPAREVHIPQLKADGFSLGQMPRPTQTRTQIGSVVYNLVICRLTATAARTGALALGPAQTTLTLVLPVQGRRQRDFFGNVVGQDRAVNIASDVVALRVLPLPRENVPPGFSGAIGSYRMNVTAGPTNLTVGDPITVRLQIAGNGPIENLQFPAQTDWRDFTTYPPTAKAEVSDPLGLAGTKNFEQVVIPQNHELKALPPLRFAFFDPQAKAYRTLSSPAFPLNIRAANAAAPPPSPTNSAAGASPPPADDIVHIRPRLEATGAVAPLLALQPWFLGVQSAPFLLWLTLLVWRKRAESLANNPKLRRQREVAARVRDAVKELRAHAAAQQSAEFFAALFRVLQEQLGERLDLPASAITEAVIDERLRGRGLADDDTRALHELFQSCNAARYAPNRSAQELSAFLPKLEGVLRALQGLKN